MHHGTVAGGWNATFHNGTLQIAFQTGPDAIQLETTRRLHLEPHELNTYPRKPLRRDQHKVLLMLGRNPNNNREFTVEDKSELVTHGRQYYQVYRHDRLIASWYVDRSHGLDLHFLSINTYDPHNYTPPAATPPTTDDN